jgi:predicted PurR-regulated permease PerM
MEPPFQSSPSGPGLSPSRYYARAFGLATTAVLGYGLVRLLSPLTTPLLWASLLAFMLHPLQSHLERRWKRPMVVSGVITAGVFLVVAGPLAVFVFAFLRQASELLTRFQAEASSRRLPALELVLEFGPVQLLLEKLGTYTALTKEQILSQATDAAQSVLQQLASLGGTVVLGAFSVVTQFLLTLFLLFFFLRDGRAMLLRGVRLVPMTAVRKEELMVELGGVTRAVMQGTLATAVVQGTLLGIGFAIAGIPSPLVFAAIGAVASLIPIVGTALVWVPAVATLVANGNTGWGVFLTVWCAVLVAGSDNVVRPWVISGRSSASTLLVFVGLLGGVSTFGFAGIFMGPLLLTLVAALLKYADVGMVQPVSVIVGPSDLGAKT